MAAGVASAAAFATSNALQHRAAGTVPPSVRRALAVLRHLARQRIWLVATCISGCAMLLHAIALRIGSIALVQPLMLAGVVLAVPMRSALEHKLPRWCEVRAVGVTVVGLAVFVLSANPQPSGVSPRIAVVIAFVLGCFAAGLCTLRTSRRCSSGAPGRQAALLGAGAGVMFGATAGLLKLVSTLAIAGHGNVAMLATVLAMLVGAGLLGTAMNQRAYQIAPIAYSMPLVNVVDIIMAVLFGAVVFGELPGHSVSVLAVQLTALAVVGVGLRLISGLRTDGPVHAVVAVPTTAVDATTAGQLR
jgi:drug/metabolite transporter (DMT)-like permease